MANRRRNKLALIASLAGLGALALVLLGLEVDYRLVGDPPPTRFNLVLVDESGRHIEGAEVRVIDQSGNLCFGHPIEEFIGERGVVSNRRGGVQLHLRIYGRRHFVPLAYGAFASSDAYSSYRLEISHRDFHTLHLPLDSLAGMRFFKNREVRLHRGPDTGGEWCAQTDAKLTLARR